MKRPGSEIGPTLLVGRTSSRLIKPDEVFHEVVNMYRTEDGGYRSSLEPIALIHTASGGNPGSGTTPVHDPLTYGPMHGIHYARLKQGQRDVLLLHTGNQIWEFRWWDRKWYPLIGPTTVTQAQCNWEAPDDDARDWPTQFVTVHNGIIIIPQGGRAHFYDGTICAPLGFDETPSPPSPLGPESSKEEFDPQIGAAANPLDGVNDIGFSRHRLRGRLGFMDPSLGYGRIGTVFTTGIITADNIDATSNTNHPRVLSSGYLLPGRFRYQTQLIDHWGNLSAPSQLSEEVRLRQRPATRLGPSANPFFLWTGIENVQMQFAVQGVPTGPDHTRGRLIGRNKDLENSGDVTMYVLPQDGQGHEHSFATLPDNVTEFYPDNVPDAWLTTPMNTDVIPVPNFRLGALAMGRFWMANWDGAEGALVASEVGLWGTPLRSTLSFPDPQGAEITGLHAVDGGLLVFTRSSVFMISPNDRGDGFRQQTLSSTVGCVAPGSIATMRNGPTVWLGVDGFYAYANGTVQYIFADHEERVKQFNVGRIQRSVACFDWHQGQYNCWVPSSVGDDTVTLRMRQVPNRRFKFDGENWTWDQSIDTAIYGMHDVTVSPDARGLIIGCGLVSTQTGVWVIDRGEDFNRGRVKTGWLRGLVGPTRRRNVRLHLWLRETRNFTGAIDDTVNELQNHSSHLVVYTRRNYRAENLNTQHIPRFHGIDEDFALRRQNFTSGLVPATTATEYQLEPNPTFWDDDVDVTDATLVSSQTDFGGPRLRTRRPFWHSVDVEVGSAEAYQFELTGLSKWEILGIRIEEQVRDEAGAGGRS